MSRAMIRSPVLGLGLVATAACLFGQPSKEPVPGPGQRSASRMDGAGDPLPEDALVRLGFEPVAASGEPIRSSRSPDGRLLPRR